MLCHFMNINDLKKSQNEKQTIFHEKRQSVLILFNTFIKEHDKNLNVLQYKYLCILNIKID